MWSMTQPSPSSSACITSGDPSSVYCRPQDSPSFQLLRNPSFSVPKLHQGVQFHFQYVFKATSYWYCSFLETPQLKHAISSPDFVNLPLSTTLNHVWEERQQEEALLSQPRHRPHLNVAGCGFVSPPLTLILHAYTNFVTHNHRPFCRRFGLGKRARHMVSLR
jgi:hypothetical protein